MSSTVTSVKPHEIVMPQLGLSMDSGVIVRWLKNTGDPVQPGEILLEIESDKSIVEVEAVANGMLHIELGPEAGAVKVGKVIGYLLAEGQAAVLPGAPSPGETSDLLPVEPAAPAASPNTPASGAPNGMRRPASTPAARRRAAELGLDWMQARPTGRRGQIREQDVLALSAAAPAAAPAASPIPAAELQITPVARRLAQATGLNLAALAGSHPNARIGREEVEQALRQANQARLPGPAAVTQPLPAASGGASSATQPAWPLDEIQRSLPARREPISLVRRAVAERMAASVHQGAAVTLTMRADATELVRLRTTMKAGGSIQPVPSYNVLLAALIARALSEHPALNAAVDGEEIVYWEIVNIGIAVDTARGLVVPVLRDAAAKNLAQLASEADELLARAAAGKARPDELSGGTFTLTNLGAEEIEFFTPIINPPQCAVLGVGQLTRAWGVGPGDQPELRTLLPLSLSFDHRLVDGAPAARFLKRVKQFVEQPYLWLR